ncbi:MAG TPA: class A beta-lactamase [Pyrinomonadaceae bacterium]|nr:class A beta-lactamase [Pyrinomonadaceae bacterium]
MFSRTALNFVVVIAVGFSACLNRAETSAPPASQQAASSTPAPPGGVGAGLAARLKAICERAGGRCGVAVTHVETGRGAAFEGDTRLPLYSVFKLPLAVAVLKEVEEGRLQLDQKVRVEPEEAAPGTKANSDLWVKASDRTVRELLEFSIIRSDNTSSDKLLELVGGPEAVTRRMRALGLLNIEVRATVKEFLKNQGKEAHPNTGTPADLARLLALLQKGEVLAAPQLEVLLGFMGRAVTGDRRLRAGPPAGTPVADKTGTGPSTTNDVGLITLPDNRGHLALAVLLDGSKLTTEKQEDLIAEAARAAYDAHVKGK